MDIDLRNCPKDKSFAEHIALSIGVYVKVADYTVHRNVRSFRLIVDPDLYGTQVEDILKMTFQDLWKTYHFAWLEAITAPVVDDIPQRNTTTSYLRITYM